MKILWFFTNFCLLTSGVLSQIETTTEEVVTTTLDPNRPTCAVRGHCYRPVTHWFLCVDNGDARPNELSPEADAILKKRCPEIYSGSKLSIFFFHNFLVEKADYCRKKIKIRKTHELNAKT